jgi:hypothetical protein
MALSTERVKRNSNQGGHDSSKWNDGHRNSGQPGHTGNLLQPNGHCWFFAKQYCREEEIPAFPNTTHLSRIRNVGQVW